MECLSAGRGISLPATANASSKAATFGIMNYIKVRDQFKMPIGNMEAIQEKVNAMVYNTWIIQSSIELMNDILDEGNSPAVLSAIMKQQTTERGREVLNHGMDIHGGAAICIGYSNFMEKFYRAAPIGITVEGSNTLTRSLIIFGQGLNKSHPFIFPLLDSVLKEDINKFNSDFKNILIHSLKLYCLTFNISNLFPGISKSLENQIIDFAALTNFVALKGGALKREQMFSGTMADIFSNLYLALSVQYYHNHYNTSLKLTDYIINKLVNENKKLINCAISNLGPERILLNHLKKTPDSLNFDEEREIYNEIMNNPNIMREIKKNIVLNNNILADLEYAGNNEKILNGKEIFIDKELIELKKKVINVGEYLN